MSQAKVDQYKASKKNRKQELKKAKRNKALAKIIGVIVAAAIVCWIGYSGYHYYTTNKPVSHTEVNLDAVNDYLSTLSDPA